MLLRCFLKKNQLYSIKRYLQSQLAQRIVACMKKILEEDDEAVSSKNEKFLCINHKGYTQNLLPNELIFIGWTTFAK